MVNGDVCGGAVKCGGVGTPRRAPGSSDPTKAGDNKEFVYSQTLIKTPV